MAMGVKVAQGCGEVEWGIFCDEFAGQAGDGREEALADCIHECGDGGGAKGSGDVKYKGGVRDVADNGGGRGGEASEG